MKERQLNDGHKAIYRNPGFGPNALFCPTAGNINGGTWKFCSACGKPLIAIEAEPQLSGDRARMWGSGKEAGGDAK